MRSILSSIAIALGLDMMPQARYNNLVVLSTNYQHLELQECINRIVAFWKIGS